MRRRSGWLAAAALAVGLASAPASSEAVPRETALLRGLDKVTARVSTFEAPVGETVSFGALRIRVRHCDRTPPEEPPEAAAFLEIDEVKPAEEPVAVFTGWMFASSPGLNALEHPVYDVWVLDCAGANLPESDAPVSIPTPSSAAQ